MALTLYFAMLATSIAGVIAIVAVGTENHTLDLHIEWMMEASDSILVAIWCAFTWRSLSSGLRSVARARWYLAAVGFSFATYLAATIASMMLERISGAKFIEMAKPVFDAGYGWLAVVISDCLQPAIVEELAFRGVILGALGRFLKPAEALVISSMMFMVIHLAPMSFPHLLLVGLALGLLRIRSGSLYPGMVLHFLHNLYCVLAEVYLET